MKVGCASSRDISYEKQREIFIDTLEVEISLLEKVDVAVWD